MKVKQVKNIGNTHLSPSKIKHIKALFESGQTSAKINRCNWFVISGNSENEYELRMTTKDRGIGFIGSELRISSYNYRVKIIK